jgi:putative DNA primase/helicase
VVGGLSELDLSAIDSPAIPASNGKYHETTEPSRKLAPNHERELFEESGLSPEIVDEAGIYTEATKAGLAKIGFPASQQNPPALVFPGHGVDREINHYQIKPDHPRVKGGKPLKYETRAGQSPRIYVPPSVWNMLSDPSRPLWWTEGAKKALAMAMRGICCVSAPGVWSFKSGCEIRDLDRINFKRRLVYVAYDSDAVSKRDVRAAMAAIGGTLSRRGAKVLYVTIPTPDGRKMGLDDFLASGGTIDELVAASLEDPPYIGPAATIGSEPKSYPLTDLGNAERLVDKFGGDLRYCAPFNRWLAWDGRRWLQDETGGKAVRSAAVETVRGILAEAAGTSDDDERKKVAAWALASESAKRIKDMIDLARTMGPVPVLPHELDQGRSLVNLANGTLDMRTFEMRPHERLDMLTRVIDVPYDSEADCPKWISFLDVALQNDAAIQRYLWKACGYSLTGEVSEKCFFFLYGNKGDNGKSVFVNLLMHVLGPYAERVPTETLMAKMQGGGVPNDVAKLRAARCVAAAEAGEGKRLNEELVKELTGNDVITARFMRGEWFDFRPQFKIWMTGNYKPTIRGQDDAMWKRVRLIPFVHSVPVDQQNKRLTAELVEEETAGILAWMIEGCMAWRKEGLVAPSSIVAAVDAYRSDMDDLGKFLEDCTTEGEYKEVGALKLYQAYEKWSEINGMKPLNNTNFGRRLSDRGVERRKTRDGWKYGKLALNDDETLDLVYRGGD